MSIRPLTATATTAGALLGMSALFLTVTPTATAAENTAAPTRSGQAPGAAAGTAQRDPLPVAHRGASAYAPENTLAAVDKARQLGIEWVENDVQRTKDGELVVIHDTTLSRTTDVEQRFPDRAPWNVSDFTAKEIKSLDAGSWFSKEFEGEKIPTLDEYLARVTKNGQELLLELKAPELYPGIERQTLGELRQKGWLNRHHTKNKLIIQSFNADAVAAVHQDKPEVKTGFLGTPKASELESYAKFADQINPTHTDVSKEYVDAVHDVKGPHHRRLEVFTWTVNDAETAKKVAGAGVDGIISNKPDVVRDAAKDSAAPAN
ncbi:glycerophosphodiester phosphodiesterase family protein [Streptomyces sp. NBC_01795]|uniref:glycerophosphodiester phosphodiesterase n=1 Tax=unclassified Streptomyces TaxID=2593676 RepID=UPI002DDC4D5E|nr:MULTISPECIES: glycerophosphodiester phosphodiesterase family protein [unclassified Streptomyces]WSA95585.1 glycerophosphodiester phosphodiesterase family protein [Streptomyces sp. NBC_01795]WSS11790.1 glycerophosphodiester phosphodiesterase family protein [Streptomyces sp. NBC_01186]